MNIDSNELSHTVVRQALNTLVGCPALVVSAQLRNFHPPASQHFILIVASCVCVFKKVWILISMLTADRQLKDQP